MTQSEKKTLNEKLINDLKRTNGYVKGYTQTLCRVMDEKHNPLYNIQREIINDLIQRNLLKLSGLIYKLNTEN